MTLKTICLLVAAALWPASALAGPTAAATPASSNRFEPTSCWFSADARVGPHRCGIVRVPAHRKPDRGEIALKVIVLQATGTNRVDDPVIFLPGGPGSSAVRNPSRWYDDPMRARRDLILMDPRGSWGSGDFCPDLAAEVAKTSAEDLTLAAQSRRKAEAAKACRQQAEAAGVTLSDYRTSALALDLEVVRKALAVKRWNILSVSYGTTVALAYARLSPGSIRALVLDSVSPIDPAWRSRGGENFDYALQQLIKRCAADQACATDYPDLGKTFSAAVTGLADPLWSTDHKFALNPQDFVMAIHRMLYAPETIALAPFVISRIRARDGAFLGQLSQALGGGVLSHAYGAHWAIDCQGRGVPATLTQAEIDAFPLTSEYAAVCPKLGLKNEDVEARAPRHSNVPTLTFAGELDPITPCPVSEKAARIFSKGFFVVIPGNGHTPTGSSICAKQVMRAFFDAPAQQPDLSCATSKPIRFASPAAAQALLAGFSGDKPKTN